MQCPERYTTERLLLRKPALADAGAMFASYAGDPAVGHYLAWPIHKSVAETRQFIEFSNDEWDHKPGGPYLIWSREHETLIGSTGFAFESERCGSTGYVIAKDFWGQGFATEGLTGITRIAASMHLERLYALCHPDHWASQHVLKKCGFREETNAEAMCTFPNQENTAPQPVLSFAWGDSG